MIRPDPNVPLGRVAMTKQVAHIADIRMEQAYIERFPPLVAVVKLGGFRTLLVVPMLKEDELVGAIGIYRQEVVRSPTSRSNSSRISLPRPSSPSRTRACSTSCAQVSAAADRHRRRAQGHQPLDLRS